MAYEWLKVEQSSDDWILAEREPEVVLSQFGLEGQPFRNRPRLEGRGSRDPEMASLGRIHERDLSMLEGTLTAEAASLAVLGRSRRPGRLASAKVRYFRIAPLWAADLGVYRSPSKRSPNHVSVVPSPRLKLDSSDLAAQAEFWDHGGSGRLDAAEEEVHDE